MPITIIIVRLLQNTLIRIPANMFSLTIFFLLRDEGVIERRFSGIGTLMRAEEDAIRCLVRGSQTGRQGIGPAGGS